MADNQEKYFQISSTLDKYTRISKNTGNISENEIRVKSSKETKFYVGYALHMLEKSNSESITIKATGNAIPKAVNVVEILKRRVENIHQINRVRNVEVEDTYEPLEEGLDTVIVKRYLSLIEITLTKKLEPKQNQEPGYQQPLPAHELNTVHNQAFRTQVQTNIYNSRGSYGNNPGGYRQRISQPSEHYRNDSYGHYPNTRYENRSYPPNDNRGYGANDGSYGYSGRGGYQNTRPRAPLQGNNHYGDKPAQPQRGARKTRGGGDTGGGRRNHNHNHNNNNQEDEYQPKVQSVPRQRIGNN